MAIEVYVPSMLRQFTDGRPMVEAEGKNIGECLKYLVQKYPGLNGHIFGKDGKLKAMYEIYVNGKSAFPNELEKEVMDGDKVYITLMLAGG